MSTRKAEIGAPVQLRPRLFRCNMDVRLRDVESAGSAMIDGEQRGVSRRIDVNGNEIGRCIRMRAGSEDLTIAQAYSFEGLSFQGPFFERDDPAHGDAAASLRLGVERIGFSVRSGPAAYAHA